VMKEVLIFWCILAMMYFLMVNFCQAKDIDLSIIVGMAYNQGTWGSGGAPQPGGTHRDEWIGMNFSTQIKYHGWIFEKWQPTFEIGYRKERFDFSDAQAPIQLAKPTDWRVLAGVTREFESFSIYGLFGYSFYHPHVELLEARPLRYHGSNHGILDKIPTFKLGGYKLWEIGGLKVGPEISTEIFTRKPGFSRCRKFDSSLFVPSIGLRIQW
jgi:hypothetical protein